MKFQKTETCVFRGAGVINIVWEGREIERSHSVKLHIPKFINKKN